MAGSLSPASFLFVTFTSYLVSGFRPTKLHVSNGVSKPGVHVAVPDSLIRTTEVTLGFHLASNVRPIRLGSET